MTGGGVRHALPDRLFHWIMAVLVVLLLGTAFLPIVGVRFPWVTIHWVSGVLLIAAVLFHLYRAFAVHGLAAMMPAMSDIPGRRADAESGAKYDLWQKGYHWSAALVLLVLLATGALILVRIDTPAWNRDPSILSDGDWGVVYALHGGSALILIFLFMLHVYFALLPEHRRLLMAMALGRPVDGAPEQPP